MSQGSNKRGVEKKWRVVGWGGAGAEREKKGDLEKRFAFRKK